jgi:PAS domain S-box-containing protein
MLRSLLCFARNGRTPGEARRFIVKQDVGQSVAIKGAAYAPSVPGREKTLLPDAWEAALVDRASSPHVRFDDELAHDGRGLSWSIAERRRAVGALATGEWARRRLEEGRASEARFHTLARLAPIGIFRRDVGGAYQDVNDAWCAITGVSPERALGSGWIPHLHLDDRDRIRAEWERAVAAEAPVALEYRVNHPDGGTIWLCERAVVERDGARRAVGYVGTITDVTDRKRADEERQRLFLAAVEANRAKDDFLATLAHELRSPLGSIVLWIRLLRGGNLDVGPRAVDVIERNAQLLSWLVEDILDVARIASGKLSVQLTCVDLHSIVAAALEAVRPAMNAKHLRLEAHLDRRKTTVQGNVVRLHQILNNLLTNAIKFTPDGGRIAVELAQAESAARITVSDTGRGIAPDFVPCIFERFQQADAASGQPQDGLGLGLGIVRYLVERHGGTIAAASPGLGQGATFSVTLPLSPEEAEVTDRSSASAAGC